MFSMRRRACAMLCAVALGACTTPAQSLRFRPPRGWIEVPGGMPHARMWMPVHADQVLTLVETRRSSLPGIASLRLYIRRHPGLNDQTLVAIFPYRVCNRQRSILIHLREVNPVTGQPEIEEVLWTISNGRVYFATYSRLAIVPDDSAAEASIRSICALGS